MAQEYIITRDSKKIQVYRSSRNNTWINSNDCDTQYPCIKDEKFATLKQD